jgi:hypothetical protein
MISESDQDMYWVFDMGRERSLSVNRNYNKRVY